MRLLELTLPSPAENLALDEALLEEAESAAAGTETLRLWEPGEPVAVVGRSSKIDGEIHREACRELGIPILRRPSGGAAVLIGPGCLMYALVLRYPRRRGPRPLDHAHRFVLPRLAAALRPLAPGVRDRGTSDLALGRRKFSGNSVRLKRHHFLYHGTLLYDFPLELVDRCLRMPARQPEYRNRRSHREFLTNLPLAPAAIRGALVAAWGACQARADWPEQRTACLAAEKYGRWEWNEQGRG